MSPSGGADPGEALFLEPRDWFARLTRAEITPREAPLEVDAGCGDGAFVLAMARRHPERDFLAIERLLGRLRKVARRGAREGLTNLRLLRIEIGYAVRHLLPAGQVAVLHVGFPDPWPRLKHHRRRIVTPAFLRDALAALAPSGEIRLKTDHADYFAWMREAAAACAPDLREIPWEEEPDYPPTDFERGFVERGLPIYRLRLAAR